MNWWIILFLAIAFAGLVLTICCLIWLAHKASDLAFELRRIGKQFAEIGGLAEEVLAHADRAFTKK